MKEIFGGGVYKDNGKYISHKWWVSKESDIRFIKSYFDRYESLSVKVNRLRKVPLFYSLKLLKAHKATPNSELGIKWSQFVANWKTWS